MMTWGEEEEVEGKTEVDEDEAEDAEVEEDEVEDGSDESDEDMMDQCREPHRKSFKCSRG